jgi:PhoPQ-activated pathogenicity-related protein
MSNYPKDPRIEFLEIYQSSGKKWFRYTWGIRLSDSSVSLNYDSLIRVTNPSNGYKTKHSDYEFISDDDIFEADKAYEDFLIFNQD